MFILCIWQLCMCFYMWQCLESFARKMKLHPFIKNNKYLTRFCFACRRSDWIKKKNENMLTNHLFWFSVLISFNFFFLYLPRMYATKHVNMKIKTLCGFISIFKATSTYFRIKNNSVFLCRFFFVIHQFDQAKFYLSQFQTTDYFSSKYRLLKMW